MGRIARVCRFIGTSWRRWSLWIAALWQCSAVIAAEPPLSRLKSGEIRLGVYSDIAPMSSLGANGYEGFSVDLCRAIVDRTASQRNAKPSIRMVPINAQNRFDKIRNAEIDLECGATTVTQKRLESYGFTYWTFVTGTNYLVLREQGKNATLRGKRVAVIENTSNERALDQHRNMMLIDFQKVAVKSPDEGFALLLGAKVDAFVLDEILLFGWRARQPRPERYLFAPRALTTEPFGFMTPKADQAWLAAMNAALLSLYRDGSYDRIYAKWFGGPAGMKLNPHMREAQRLPTSYGIPD
jgi:ABC-type amino acid transport substrate-binding protein